MYEEEKNNDFRWIGLHHEMFEIIVSVEFVVLHDYVHVDVEDELQPEKIFIYEEIN